MEITKMRMSDIRPYGNNAKSHPDAQIQQIMDSIREFGNNDPIAVDEEGVIIEGHGRYAALKRLGYRETEVIVLKGLNEDQKNAYRLVHNQLTMNSGFDMDALKAELERIEMDLTEFDLGMDIFAEEKADIEEDEPVDPNWAPKRCEAGDVWILGNHRLMCGDSTSEDDIGRLCEYKSADLIVTDPPYNVNVENSQGMTIANDNMSEGAFEGFIDRAMGAMSQWLKEGGAFYVFYGDNSDIAFRKACFGNSLQIKECLIWVKNSFTLGRQDYQWRHEPCLYGWKEGAAHYFIGERDQDTVIEDKPDIDRMSKAELKAALRDMLETHPETIIREDKPAKDDLHPTQKPVRLCAKFVRNSSRKGERVLDPFSGSGSTMMACEQLGRSCLAMELDPRYCDAIIERWERFTGKKAEKEK